MNINFTWLVRSENGSPVIHDSVQVVGVKCNSPAPILHLFSRETGVVEPELIGGVSRAVRTSGPRQRWDLVNCKAHVLRMPSLPGAIRYGYHGVIRCHDATMVAPASNLLKT